MKPHLTPLAVYRFWQRVIRTARARLRLARLAFHAAVLACLGGLGCVLTMAPAAAEPDALQAYIEEFIRHESPSVSAEASDEGEPAPTRRIEVELGQLDPRLKLAPCDKVRAYVPQGAALWGKSRVGLKCEQGSARWNVFWPVTVKVYGQALVAVVPLRPGALVNTADLRMAEVDLAAHPSPAVVKLTDVVGRAVVRNIEPGQSIRQDDIKLRRWFAAGDPVRLMVKGKGFQISSEGTALTPGDEGRCARVRTEAGRVVCALPVGDRQVELVL